jgi:hypothetical protein
MQFKMLEEGKSMGGAGSLLGRATYPLLSLRVPLLVPVLQVIVFVK